MSSAKWWYFFLSLNVSTCWSRPQEGQLKQIRTQACITKIIKSMWKKNKLIRIKIARQSKAISENFC